MNHRIALKYFCGSGVVVIFTLFYSMHLYSRAGIQRGYSSSRAESQNIEVDDSTRVEWFSGKGIIRQDFENCSPHNAIIRDSILKGFWNLRTKGADP